MRTERIEVHPSRPLLARYLEPPMSTDISIAAIWNVSAAVYHADQLADSHSTLEIARKSVAHWYKLKNHLLPRPEPTPAMRLGIAAHVLLLQPSEFDALVAVKPHLDRRTKDGKQEGAIFDGYAIGKTIISEEQFEVAQRIRDAVLAHQLAAEFIEIANCKEMPIRWECPRTRWNLRCMPDLVLDSSIVNLKTASDPSPDAFQRQSWNLGYYRGAALYCDGFSALIDKEINEHWFIVVGSEEPYDVGVYRSDEEFLRLGREHYLETILMLQNCGKVNCWQSPWTTGVNTLSLPAWAKTREERSFP